MKLDCPLDGLNLEVGLGLLPHPPLVRWTHDKSSRSPYDRPVQLMAVVAALSIGARAAAPSSLLRSIFDGNGEAVRLGPSQFGEVPAVPAAVEVPAVDSDEDGLSDAEELMIARAAAPELEWAPNETCGEHDIVYQVHPLAKDRARVVYNLVFPFDCGFRGSGFYGHHGDVQEIKMDAARDVSGRWRAVALYDPFPVEIPQARWPLRLFVSDGKHHIYRSAATCGHRMLDACGGGDIEIMNIDPANNVGEEAHPAFTNMARFARGPWAEGYAGEAVWGKSRWGDDLFCGGDPKRGHSRVWWRKRLSWIDWGPCGDSLSTKWCRIPMDGKPPLMERILRRRL